MLVLELKIEQQRMELGEHTRSGSARRMHGCELLEKQLKSKPLSLQRSPAASPKRKPPSLLPHALLQSLLRRPRRRPWRRIDASEMPSKLLSLRTVLQRMSLLLQR